MNTTQTLRFDQQQFLSTYQNKKLSGATFIRFIASIHANGGPNPSEYQTINAVLNYYILHLSNKQIFRLHKKMAKIFGANYLDSTAGHATIKPYGYPGDYEIMDKLYLKAHSPQKAFLKWDKFFHWQPAAKCIINRKAYFKRVVKEKLAQKRQKNEDLQVMNIACGPGRDVFELFEEEGPSGLYFDFVDADLNAILHATRLNYKYLPHITFHNANIFKFETPKKVDFIWSGGLFDYFDDKTFIAMIAKIQHYLKPGGEMIIGNVSPFNPTRGYMELFVGWFIYHRSKEELIDMAQQACGDNIEHIAIGVEPEKVNYFVHIKLK